MAWGSVSKPPPPPHSALSKLLPLLIFFIVLGAFAFIGYQIYLVSQEVTKSASEKMASKNVSFTKDGVKVGVKELQNEKYVDKTQGFLVKAWNLSSWPAYQSKLGWAKENGDGNGNGNGGKLKLGNREFGLLLRLHRERMRRMAIESILLNLTFAILLFPQYRNAPSMQEEDC